MIVAGVLGPIEDFLAAVIDWLGPHGAIGLPWAWAIVALTVLVRMALVPLTVKQIHSMQNLQRHAPEMKEIQRKYKGDRAKMNTELMAFYKENSINPASSCLPILFQIPIFIALFFVLRDFEDTTDYHAWRQPRLARAREHHGAGERGLGRAPARHLRREPARVHVLHVGDDGADAAPTSSSRCPSSSSRSSSTSKPASSSTGRRRTSGRSARASSRGGSCPARRSRRRRRAPGRRPAPRRPPPRRRPTWRPSPRAPRSRSRLSRAA